MSLKTPNYYQASNELVDEYLPMLSGPEAKIMMFLQRKIIGFHKQGDRDYISVRQIMKGTGINSTKEVPEALKHLRELGLIRIRQPGKGKTQQITILFEKQEQPKKPETKRQKVSPMGRHSVPHRETPSVSHRETTKEILLNKQPTKERVGWLTNPTKKEPFNQLRVHGVKPEVAKALTDQHDSQTILDVVNNVCETEGINNHAGLIITRLNNIRKELAYEKEVRKEAEEREVEEREHRRQKEEKLRRQQEHEEKLDQVFFSLPEEDQNQIREQAKKKIIAEHPDEPQKSLDQWWLRDIMVMIKVREILEDQHQQPAQSSA